jgi:hypothetical protein
LYEGRFRFKGHEYIFLTLPINLSFIPFLQINKENDFSMFKKLDTDFDRDGRSYKLDR